MDGLNQLTAADHALEIAGRTYRLGTLTLKDLGEIENRIVSKRPDPLAVAVEKLDRLDQKQQEFLLGRAYDRAALARRATVREVEAWRRTREGICYLFWLMVRKHQPEITLEKAVELVDEMADEVRAELCRRIDEGSGLPPVNPSRPAQQRATA